MNYEEVKKLKVGDRVRLQKRSSNYAKNFKAGNIYAVCTVPDNMGDYTIAITDPCGGYGWQWVSWEDIELIGKTTTTTLTPLTFEQVLDLKVGDEVVILKTGKKIVINEVCGSINRGESFRDNICNNRSISSIVEGRLHTFLINELALPLPEVTPVDKIEELRKEFNDKLEVLKLELEKNNYEN